MILAVPAVALVNRCCCRMSLTLSYHHPLTVGLDGHQAASSDHPPTRWPSLPAHGPADALGWSQEGAMRAGASLFVACAAAACGGNGGGNADGGGGSLCGRLTLNNVSGTPAV